MLYHNYSSQQNNEPLQMRKTYLKYNIAIKKFRGLGFIIGPNFDRNIIVFIQ